MAASFVNHGAIDWKMFMDANPGEPVNVFAKLYPYFAELRSMFASKFDDAQAFQYLEQVIMQQGKVMIEKENGKEILIKPDHSFFFIRMRRPPLHPKSYKQSPTPVPVHPTPLPLHPH